MNRWSPNETLSRQAILTDPWDLKELRTATKGMRAYGKAKKKLKDFASTGDDALADAFWSLAKANPTVLPAVEVRPSHLVNRMVAGELLGLPSTRRLREYTVGDGVQAADGCVTLAPMLETIFDRLHEEQALAEELEARLATLLALRAELSEAQKEFDADLGDDPSDEDLARARGAARDLRTARREIEAMEAELDQAAEELQDRLEAEGPSVRHTMRAAVGAAADDAQATAESAHAWGLSPGQLRQLPAAERLKLAKTLNQPKMREIADLFGRIRSLSLYDRASKVDSVHEEIIDLELGSDLGRVVPSELLLLGHPLTEHDFLARWSDGELLQYSVQGDDELGRGGIVMCIDTSLSMAGDPEKWSKAVMLVLMHEARAQRRTMHVIHFGAPGEIKHMPFLRPEDFTAERIFEAAGAFFGSGTDFESPMATALGILSGEFAETGATKADVVFATDDECRVSETFMTHYLDEMHRMGARTYGLDMRGFASSSSDGALARMSEGRVASIHDFNSGQNIRPMLMGISA